MSPSTPPPLFERLASLLVLARVACDVPAAVDVRDAPPRGSEVRDAEAGGGRALPDGAPADCFAPFLPLWWRAPNGAPERAGAICAARSERRQSSCNICRAVNTDLLDA